MCVLSAFSHQTIFLIRKSLPDANGTHGYGILDRRTTMADDFDPAGDWWYWDDEERDEDNHQYNCTCESCLQNHPERDILYGDGEYFEYGDKK